MKLYDYLVDFGIPVFIIFITALFIITDIDGEVKTIFTLAAGWAFKSALRRVTPTHKE